MSSLAKASSSVLLKPCNVCGNLGESRCSRCHCRSYCSVACQKRDWKLHKQYCCPPMSKRMKLLAVKARCEENHDEVDFEEIRRAADDPTDGYSVERALWIHLKLGVLDFPYMLKDWALDTPQVWEEIDKLPLNAGCFCVSFMTVGDMDPSTGELSYFLNAADTISGDIRTSGLCKGPPTKHILEELLYTCMVKPIEGRPECPSAVLFANRWGEETSQEYIDLLSEKLDIFGCFESKRQAELSAGMNGTDPDGYNW